MKKIGDALRVTTINFKTNGTDELMCGHRFLSSWKPDPGNRHLASQVWMKRADWSALQRPPAEVDRYHMWILMKFFTWLVVLEGFKSLQQSRSCFLLLLLDFTLPSPSSLVQVRHLNLEWKISSGGGVEDIWHLVLDVMFSLAFMGYFKIINICIKMPYALRINLFSNYILMPFSRVPSQVRFIYSILLQSDDYWLIRGW